MYQIAVDHPESIEQDATKPHAVLRVEGDVTGVVESFATIEDATTAVRDLIAADEAASAEPIATANVELRITGIEELERAAALVDRIHAGLNSIGSNTNEIRVSTVLADGEEAPPFEGGEEIIPPPVEAEVDGEAEFGGLPVHSTEVLADPFDCEVMEAKVTPVMEGGAGYYAALYGWVDPTANPDAAESYEFLHHFVGDAGEPGAASTVGCLAAIDKLNGIERDDDDPEDEEMPSLDAIPGVEVILASGAFSMDDLLAEADRQSVYDHLSAHLMDGGVSDIPVLVPQAEYEARVAAHEGAEGEVEDDENEDDESPEMTPEVSMAENTDDDTTTEGGNVALADLPDDALVEELARRWAENTAAEITADPEAELAEGEEATTEVAAEETTELAADDSVAEALEAEEATVEEAAAAAVEDAVEAAEVGEEGEVIAFAPDRPFDWEAVLIVEGTPSGDGRMVEAGVLTWRELPIPLMSQTVNASGHEGSVIAGSIAEIERVQREGYNEIIGRGYYDSGDAGQELRRLITEGTMRGVSADVDSVMVEFRTPEGAQVDIEEVIFGEVDALEVLVAGRIMGATATPFPAFQEASIRNLDTTEVQADEALVAAGGVIGDVYRISGGGIFAVGGREDATTKVEALVASGAVVPQIPVTPPRAWFEKGEMTEPVPFTVHPDGRCYGLIARWGTCHIGFTDRCVNVPRTGEAYKSFRNKSTLTAEGDLVATGPIFMDTVHPNLRLAASDAQAHYADTGCAVADVALYENEFGIVAAGAARPDITPEQMRRFRGSDVSPDWRMLKGRLEAVALLSVNCSGFIVENEALVASAGAESSAPRGLYDSVEGEVTALVAAGMVRHAPEHTLRGQVEALRAEVAELREAFRPIRAERAAAALAERFGTRPAATETATEEHGCGGACGGTEGACSCEV